MTSWTDWALLDDAERARVAERSRPQMLELARGMGARTAEEVRAALELVAAAIRAELDAAEPTPLPALNRAQRRAAGRRRP